MKIEKKQWLVIGISSIIVLVVVSAAQLFFPRIAVSPSESVSEPLIIDTKIDTSIATSSKTESQKSIQKFPINKKDTIVSWSFNGAYSGNETLLAKANADTAYLKNLLGKGQYNDYDLYMGIGNNKGSVGDGAGAYQSYNLAIALNPDRALAYANMGHLMEQLGAYYTAADAYAKAVAAEPSVAQYRNSQLDFLTRQFPDEAERLKTSQ